MGKETTLGVTFILLSMLPNRKISIHRTLTMCLFFSLISIFGYSDRCNIVLLSHILLFITLRRVDVIVCYWVTVSVLVFCFTVIKNGFLMVIMMGRILFASSYRLLNITMFLLTNFLAESLYSLIEHDLILTIYSCSCIPFCVYQ